MLKVFKILIICIGLFSVLALFPGQAYAQNTEGVEVEARIISVNNEFREQDDGDPYLYQNIELELLDGSGKTVTVINDTLGASSQIEYKLGQKVLVLTGTDLEGRDVAYITDFVRNDALYLLFGLFAFLAILVGGKRGFSSLIGMAFSFLIIFGYILPSIISGSNPVLVAIIGSVFIIPVTYYLSHGYQQKTFVAAMGTIITLVITGLLAAFAVNIVNLQGFGSEEALFVRLQLGDLVNTKGLLLAGIIISSLGILDDITISQASIVAELKRANKSYNHLELFSRAMVVGRDHISSLINTLVLVYAGAALPLLILFIDSTYSIATVINYEIIAEELVRILIGSMGLIMAVPITTVIAAYLYKDKESKSNKLK